MPVMTFPPFDADWSACPMRSGRIGGWVLGGLMALIPGAAIAQDAPLHTPCLTAHADLSGYIAAMESEGWTQLETDSEAWRAAVAVVYQPVQAMQILPAPFESLEDATRFAESAAERGARTYQYGTGVFFRDGVSASIQLGPPMGDSLRLSCVFAAPDLPQATEMLAEDAMSRDGIGLSMATEDIAVAGQDVPARLDALRLDGTPVFTAMLAGREALMLTWRFAPPT